MPFLSKKCHFRHFPGGYPGFEHFFTFSIGFSTRISRFFAKVLGFSGFSGVPVIKEGKALHCAQLIFWVGLFYAQCNGPRFYTARFPDFPENGVQKGVKNGHFSIEYGLSIRGPRGARGGLFFIYRGTGSENDCLTRVNHPPDSENGVFFDVFLIVFRSKSAIFRPKFDHF